MKELIWSNMFSSQNRIPLIKGLAKVYLFRKLSKRQLQAIEQIGHVRSFEDQEVLFIEGEPSYGLFIMLRGSVAVSVNKKTIMTYQPYDFFGELSMVEDSRRTATAISIGPSTVFYINAQELKERFKQDHRLGFGVYEALTSVFCGIISKHNEEAYGSAALNR